MRKLKEIFFVKGQYPSIWGWLILYLWVHGSMVDHLDGDCPLKSTRYEGKTGRLDQCIISSSTELWWGIPHQFTSHIIHQTRGIVCDFPEFCAIWHGSVSKMVVWHALYGYKIMWNGLFWLWYVSIHGITYYLHDICWCLSITWKII